MGNLGRLRRWGRAAREFAAACVAGCGCGPRAPDARHSSSAGLPRVCASPAWPPVSPTAASTVPPVSPSPRTSVDWEWFCVSTPSDCDCVGAASLHEVCQRLSFTSRPPRPPPPSHGRGGLAAADIAAAAAARQEQDGARLRALSCAYTVQRLGEEGWRLAAPVQANHIAYLVRSGRRSSGPRDAALPTTTAPPRQGPAEGAALRRARSW